MNDDQKNLIEKAKESLAAAELLFNHGYFSTAASRAYYAMFYIASAFVEGDGQSFSSHAAIASAFGRDFANRDRVPRHLHRYLLDAQTIRHQADYAPVSNLSPELTRSLLQQAQEFIETGDRLL
jgi:uncharacterized protein (UPF0332 family)